ncbi:MAG TPA: TetR/AcrR family transcriptional regulator [Chloroflexaceae bacterium]|nr:TetR/AcrR family transcriptional regulator [Chloroflexaceae bacterium]
MSSQRSRTPAGQSTRDQIIAATCDLMEAQGFHATGMAEIIQASGAPRGSLYYYFPEGKEGLAAEAIARTGASVAERIRANLAPGGCLVGAFSRFTDQIAAAIEHSGFHAGGPLTAVAMETATTSERLNRACRDAYGRLKGAFAEQLVAAGYPPARAAELAEFITAAIEGGIILSRTYHSGDPLRRIGRQVAAMLAASPPPTHP